MKSKIVLVLFLLTTAMLFVKCNNGVLNPTVKLHPNDPFKNTMVTSQLFEIDASQDNVIEGEDGTILVCPKGCFINSNGSLVTSKIKIELAEALSVENMLLSNLTTTSNGNPLETDGMIYFNVTANGEQLAVNKNIPVHIEIPTSEKKNNMMVYKGIRDEKGNMNWIEPIELPKQLITVDLYELDFIPEGFRNQVKKEIPFKGYKEATSQLVDSLYYLFGFNLNSNNETESRIKIDTIQISPDIPNEPYYNEKQEAQVEDKSAINHTESLKDTGGIMGINPAIIQVIKSDKYQNTLIATKDFEARLKVIFKTCNDKVLELYINNLNKNLYEIDEMAAAMLANTNYQQAFIDFASQKLTKVPEADKYADMLKGYYKTQLAKVKSALQATANKFKQEQVKKEKAAQQTLTDYKNLLWKREKYRMETYGFDYTETGWINIDRGTLPKEWSSQPLMVNITNSKQLDRVYTYVIYTSIKSLYRLNTQNNEQFYVGNNDEKQMLMPNNKTAVVIAVGYKNEAPWLAVKQFETVSESVISLTMEPSNASIVKQTISRYDQYAKENKIEADLVFMDKLYKEEKRKQSLNETFALLNRLYYFVYPCGVGPSAAVQYQDSLK